MDTHNNMMNLNICLEEKNSHTQEYVPTWLHLYEVQKQAKLIYYDELRTMVACEKDGDWLERCLREVLEMKKMCYTCSNSIGVFVTWVHAFVKTNQTVHLRCVHSPIWILTQFYLNWKLKGKYFNNWKIILVCFYYVILFWFYMVPVDTSFIVSLILHGSNYSNIDSEPLKMVKTQSTS